MLGGLARAILLSPRLRVAMSASAFDFLIFPRTWEIVTTVLYLGDGEPSLFQQGCFYRFFKDLMKLVGPAAAPPSSSQGARRHERRAANRVNHFG